MGFHYLPKFVETDGVRQKAACGAWIFPSEHSTEPNCEPCLDYLTSESSAQERVARHEQTHYVMGDAPSYRGRAAAVCGFNAEASKQAADPTCPDCRAWLAMTAEETAESRFGESVGAPLKLNTFDPCANYTPKGRR